MKFFLKKGAHRKFLQDIKKKQKIIIYLFIAAVALLISNIILDILWKDKLPVQQKKKEIGFDEINEKFKSCLHNLGLEDEWVKLKDAKKVKSRDPSAQRNIYYAVAIPEDLPIVLVVNEIQNSFNDYNANVISKEQKINGKTMLLISSPSVQINRGAKNKFLLSAELYYDKSLSRNAGIIGIFLTGIEQLNNENLNEILSIPESFEPLLVPSNSSYEIIKKLVAGSRTYGILLNDNITDLEYKLNENYSKPRLKSSIRNIFGNFPAASVFIIKSNSNLYSSTVYSLLKEEFRKRNVRLIPTDSLSDLSDESGNTGLSNFKQIVEKTKRGENVEFILNIDVFRSLQEEIIKFRKIGYKFLLPNIE